MIEASSLLCAALALAPAPPVEFAGSRLYAASVGGDRVVGLDNDGVTAQTILDAGLVDPRGIAFGPDGKLYVASGDHVLKFGGNGALEDTLGAAAGLTGARGIAIGPNGDLFVTSLTQILELRRDGTLVRSIGSGDNLHVPVGLCFSGEGHLFVTLAGDNAIAEYDASFDRIHVSTLTELAIPMGITIAPNGVRYVSSFFNASVLALDATGAVVGVFTDAALLFPSGIAVGPNGNLFVSTFFGNTIVELTPVGAKVREISLPTGATNPEGIAFAPYRWKGKLKGRLVVDPSIAKNVNENVYLAYAPGSRTLMIDLVDKTSSKDLASTLGVTGMAFYGFETFETQDAKARRVQGLELALFSAAPADPPGAGALTQSSIVLDFTGKAAPFGSSPGFFPKSATGTLTRSNSKSSLRGTIVTSSALH